MTGTRSTVLLIVCGALVIGGPLTHDEPIADLTQRVVTVEARKP